MRRIAVFAAALTLSCAIRGGAAVRIASDEALSALADLRRAAPYAGSVLPEPGPGAPQAEPLRLAVSTGEHEAAAVGALGLLLAARQRREAELEAFFRTRRAELLEVPGVGGARLRARKAVFMNNLELVIVLKPGALLLRVQDGLFKAAPELRRFPVRYERRD